MTGFDTKLIDIVAQYGIFAVLFVALLVYVLRQNERREVRLIEIINQTTPLLERLCQTTARLERSVCQIKERLEGGIYGQRDD